MEIRNFNLIESDFLNTFNNLAPGERTFENLKTNSALNEKYLNNAIELLLSKNIIIFDSKSKLYKYDSPVDGDKVILEGNILLPTTIITKINEENPEESHILVSRGEWYKFPIGFDIRRIIWNVKLQNNRTKSTLMDLVKESVLKERKSKIVQVPEYKNLVDKLIPYNKNILLKINSVGETQTDVNIIFRDYIELPDEGFTVEFRDFSVRLIIETDDLISELKMSPEERDYTRIKVNRLFNFSDFIFANNSIPYASDSETISYAKITGIKGKIELTFYTLDYEGKVTKNDKEEYTESGDGIDRIRELFASYANSLLLNNDFMVEIEN